MQIHHQGYKRKKCKIGPKGVRKGSRDLLLKFWDPLHISGTVRARNAKFLIVIKTMDGTLLKYSNCMKEQKVIKCNGNS